MACYNNTPLIAGVQYPQPCDCCTNPECPNPISSLCIYYNGPALPCSQIQTGDSLEEALEKIEEKICEGTGDYATYNVYCLAPIATQQEFVESISEKYCTLVVNFNTFVNNTFVTYQSSVTNQFNSILNPNITCTVANVLSTDTIYQVLNKYCTAITDLDAYVDISGVTWSCIVPGPISTLEDGFNALVTSICTLSSSIPVLPSFNNTGSCLAGGTASDSLTTTINLIKTRLCQTPTFDINALTWGCVTQPSVVTTDLQAAFQTVLSTLSYYLTNRITTYSPDFTVTATDPMDPCQGVTLSLAAPFVDSDRFVASNALDASPGTLMDKLTAGPNITLDALTIPGQVIISSTSDTYKVKADATDTNPDFLIDKVEGINNTIDGVSIIDTYNAITETVQLTPYIDWFVFINKMFDEIEGDPVLKDRFCDLVNSGCCDACTTTTTSTTTNVAYLDANFTVSNELASTDSADVATEGEFILTTVAPGTTSAAFIGVITRTSPNGFIITVTPFAGGTTVTLINLASFLAPGCTVVASGSGTGTLTITITPGGYAGGTYFLTGDIEVGIT